MSEAKSNSKDALRGAVIAMIRGDVDLQALCRAARGSVLWLRRSRSCDWHPRAPVFT